ncbi:MAG TPA: hypothetical protein PLT76_05815 [Candidatus Omnitrophota bacterium]|nr:hypothetical protein [Candidatus Omnitrophota bacterium]HPB67629.1 hypothetical protein [Candidatus Omnitrophota bacterium]HQO58221.1 hypothetical protein [Candidatus Omnitrophota bacterium]HQP11190.1 hypothetical protein [Candidatus Omnitrophota bacterium]
MKCYHHHDKDAVAVCRACGRALCPACVADLGRGMACKDRCEKDVNALITSFDNNRMSCEMINPRLLVRPALLAVVGAIFAYYGYSTYGASNLLFILGVAIIVIEVVDLGLAFLYIKRMKTLRG